MINVNFCSLSQLKNLIIIKIYIKQFKNFLSKLINEIFIKNNLKKLRKFMKNY